MMMMMSYIIVTVMMSKGTMIFLCKIHESCKIVL